MKTILVVDDSMTVRMDLAEALAEAGFSAEAAATLAEARQRLARGGVGLLLLDVRLPDGSGVDLLREIRAAEATRELPVLLMSSEAEVHDRIRGLSHAADDYLGKPYSLDYVIQRCGELLDGGAGPGRILLIDDSPTFRAEVGDFLVARGHAVASVGTAEEGLRLAARQAPRLILVDRQLPGMSGDEFIRRLRLDPLLRTVPCLMLTAAENAAVEVAALGAGADGYVRTSGSFDVLAARVEGLLAGAASQSVAAETQNRVLVVSPDRGWLEDAAAALRGEARDVARAHTAAEALELLPLQRVDAVVLDVAAGGLAALELCRQIKRHPAWMLLPVLALTGPSDGGADPGLQALAAQANDTAPREAGFEVVRARLAALQRRKRYEDEVRSVQALRQQVDERTRAEAVARHLAGHDPLTGLPNRLLFLEHVKGAVQRAERQGTSCALLYIDMDGFKPVNDTHGHAAGDTLLTSFGRRLLEGLRKQDRAARLGGDEFAVLLEQPIGVDEALRKAEMLVREASQPYRIELPDGVVEVRVGCSVGLALYPDHADDDDALVRAADAAMYKAKRSGKGCAMKERSPQAGGDGLGAVAVAEPLKGPGPSFPKE